MRIIAAVALAALLVGCTSLVAVGPTALPPGSTATPTDAATPAPSPGRFEPGATITLTKDSAPWATVVISKVKVVPTYKGTYNSDTPAAGNVYIQAFVTYTALIDGVTYASFDWQVFADAVAVDNFTFTINGPKPTLGTGSLPKGRKAEGWVVYEVPKAGTVLMSYGGRFGSAPTFEVVLRP